MKIGNGVTRFILNLEIRKLIMECHESFPDFRINGKRNSSRQLILRKISYLWNFTRILKNIRKTEKSGKNWKKLLRTGAACVEKTFEIVFVFLQIFHVFIYFVRNRIVRGTQDHPIRSNTSREVLRSEWSFREVL